MTTIERMAEAMYDDNLRQINATDRENYDCHVARTGERPKCLIGGAWLPSDFVESVHKPFEDAEQHVRKLYLSYARAAFDILTAPPSAEVIAAGAAAMKERVGLVIAPSFYIACATSGFEAMIRAMKEPAPPTMAAVVHDVYEKYQDEYKRVFKRPEEEK